MNDADDLSLRKTKSASIVFCALLVCDDFFFFYAMQAVEDFLGTRERLFEIIAKGNIVIPVGARGALPNNILNNDNR